MRKIVTVQEKPGDPALRELMERIRRGEGRLVATGLEGASRAFVAAELFRRLGRPVVVVAATEKEAEAWARDLAFFLGGEDVLSLPAWDLLTTDMFAFQRDRELARQEALARLLDGAPAVLVLSARAVMQKVPRPEVLSSYGEVVSIGDMRDRDGLAAKLLAGGYSRVTLVEGKGEFSVRGNIVDLFPPGSDHPVRLEFVGDELESIRQFDEATQRSLNELAEFRLVACRELILTPARRDLAVRNLRRRAGELELPRGTRERLVEMVAGSLGAAVNPLFYPLFYDEGENGGGSGLADLFAYLPAGAMLLLADPAEVGRALEKAENDLDRFLLKAREAERLFLEKEAANLTARQALDLLEARVQLRFETLSLSVGGEGAAVVRFQQEQDVNIPAGPAGFAEEGIFAPLAARIRGWLTQGRCVALACAGQECLQRMGHLLKGYGIPFRQCRGPFLGSPDGAGATVLLLWEGRLSSGFHLPAANLVLLSEEAIFGRKVLRPRLRRPRHGYFLKSFGELSEGDFVVHTEHGIGRYRGLHKLTIGGIENDFLLIAYQDEDKLYLPVDRLDQIQRYLGPEGFVPRVDKLGSTSWDAVKERVKKSVREMAEELVSLYAAREVMEREAFSAPDRIYDEFCAAFEFEETPDQAKAIEEVNLDMSGPKPMDRLICGDAGFGKTEVAMRAALRAALDGKQVAVLVPTTILAEQHYQTFTRRMKPYPIAVEVLNRFKTKAQQAAVLSGLEKGTVDIVIGTHRLLQKDVKFRNLGLVIIDEEQRFGVAHKEKLKKLRTLVDVLTLSATPIPRTLHLSLVGMRDLSLINTPPEDRLPIKTYVLEFDEELIARAVRQELGRGGQVFFLHDRVRSLFTMARLVQRLVPEARIGVVHGQMTSRQIEETMARFIRREDNVLVCTTIIGSGLDIPTANTIIVNRADRFGLAQLYQLRGRVGRAKEEAFAYLLVPRGAMLSRDAQKRLQVIMDFTEPGSGFRIASNDLEIRGAGNILGASQSGHVSAVGYELYTELMEQAIREVKGEEVEAPARRPEIHLGIPAFVPEAYMADEHQRLITYKKISLAASDEELAEIRAELADCYGPVPEEVENLLEVIAVRNLLMSLKGTKMGYDGKVISVCLQEESPIDPGRITALLKDRLKGAQLSPDWRLTVPAAGLAGRQITAQARALLMELRGGT